METLTSQTDPESPDAGGLSAAVLHAEGERTGLRRRTARGTIVNGAFLTGLNLLSLCKGFIVAALLTRSAYGVWGILSITLLTFLSLKQVGITERYIQQDESDQEVAFQHAFTVEVMVTSLFVVVMVLGMPLVALAYGEPQLLWPGWVLTLGIAAIALQSPLWVFYRRMEFVRQRSLQAVDPLVSFVVTLVLAFSGFGYWSLVIGAVAGSWAAALAALRACPFRIRLRFERGTLRDYLSFSWPLAVATVSGLLISQGSIFAGKLVIGVAGVGALVLANSLSQYVNKVDDIISQTMYPAICAARDRTAVLRETFLKSNRLALLWAVPFGAGVAIFAPDLIRFGLGARWHPAQLVIQAFAVTAALNQVCFNWILFYQARGQTRPMAVVAVVMLVAMAGITLPLLLAWGLPGFAFGIASAALIQMAARVHYVRRLFPRIPLLEHAARGIAPTLPATVAVLAIRTVDGGAARSLLLAVAELTVFLLAVAVCTLMFERPLLRELLGYLRTRSSPFGGSSADELA